MKKIEIWSDKSKSTTLNDGHEEPTFLGEFLLDKPDTAAATILILPGGGYDHFGMHEGEAVAKKFNELNFNTYVLYYRHYPQWTYPAPDILECEVKWALGSITMNKASGGDRIPVELFQILKDDAMKVLHSMSAKELMLLNCGAGEDS